MAERKSIIEHAAEISKKIDDVGIVVGLGMMVYGLLSPVWFGRGTALAGVSVLTKLGAEQVRKGAEKRRLQRGS